MIEWIVRVDRIVLVAGIVLAAGIVRVGRADQAQGTDGRRR